MADVGVDGFKEDWVDAPSVAGLPLSGGLAGIEFVRRFQWILYDETHKARPDAMVETQTVNALFRESSDVTRLNDIWYATRNVPEMMRRRARIAHISGWPVLDTDNASSTNLKEWWDYMEAQLFDRHSGALFCLQDRIDPGSAERRPVGCAGGFVAQLH